MVADQLNSKSHASRKSREVFNIMNDNFSVLDNFTNEWVWQDEPMFYEEHDFRLFFKYLVKMHYLKRLILMSKFAEEELQQLISD